MLIWYSLSALNELLPLEPGGAGDLAHWTNALVVVVLALPMVWAARRFVDRRPWSGLRLTGPAQAWRPLLVGTLSWLLSASVGRAALFTLWGTGLWVVGSGREVLAERLPLFLGMGLVLGCIRVVTGNVWACVGFHLAFQVAAQALMGWELFVVEDLDTVMGTVFLLPFVLGVTVAMMLLRDTGSWSGRVPDPVDERVR